MKRKIKTGAILLLSLVVVVAFAPMVLAQGETGSLEDVNWMGYAALVLNAVLVPLLADVLKPIWAKAPSVLKTIMPVVIGGAAGYAEAWLLTKLGFAVPLDLIVAVFTGGGAAASLAFKQGEKKGLAG